MKTHHPTWVPIHEGMSLYLTRNVRKDIDYVNGMKCTVEGYDEASKGLRVLTATGQRVVIWNWTDRDLQNTTYYQSVPATRPRSSIPRRRAGQGHSLARRAISRRGLHGHEQGEIRQQVFHWRER